MEVQYAIPSEGATLTSKGQITIPQLVRESLGLRQGDRVQFIADPAGGYRIKPRRGGHESLAGMLAGHVGKGRATQEAVDKALTQALKKKFVP